MSVMIITKREVMKLAGELTQLPEVIDIVKSDKHFNNMFMEKDPKEYLKRALWYGYIANHVAYAVNYEEQPVIDYEYWGEDEPEKVDINDKSKIIEIKSDLGSLRYNMVTNNGTIFLQKEYLNLIDNVYQHLNTKYKQKHYIY